MLVGLSQATSSYGVVTLNGTQSTLMSPGPLSDTGHSFYIYVLKSQKVVFFNTSAKKTLMIKNEIHLLYLVSAYRSIEWYGKKIPEPFTTKKECYIYIHLIIW